MPMNDLAAGSLAGVPSVKGAFFTRAVLDVFAHTGLYVINNKLGSPTICRDIFDGSGMPTGSRAINMYPVGATVLVYEPGNMEAPIIMGALPPAINEAKLLLPDWIAAGSRVGQWEDPLHYDQIKDPNIAAANYSGGRLADALPGDWGRINDLGAGFFLGRMIALLRASDSAQIQAFWGDNLLRIMGYNLETFTACSEDRKLNDEGEHHEVYRSSPFPWEALGKGGARGQTYREESVQPGPGMTYAPLEPQQDDQLIVQRHVRMRGYLGDIEREYVCIPPSGLDISQFQNEDVYLGAMEIVKHIDGSYSVRSAKQITFEKYVLLPIPKEMKSPEDPTGDTVEDYKFAGLFGNGEDHDMQEFQWEDDNPGIRAQYLWDYHAYFFGKYTQQGLINHTKDWKVPEESEITDMGDRASIDPNAVNMGHKFYAELPTPTEIKVDERTNHTTKYYATRSIIKQFDDGSILIEGGFGEQIRLEGGNIFLSCPGDIWRQPGRNDIAWAPHDVILRAGNSADLTAAKKDVRIKAEQNLHMVANSKEKGSILIESRCEKMPASSDFKDKLGESSEGGGIFVKSKEGAISLWAKRLYGGGSPDISGKQIVWDAGEDGEVFVRGRAIDSQAVNSVRMSTGEPGSVGNHISVGVSVITAEATATVIKGEMLLPDGSLQANGNLTAKGGILCESGIVSNGGIAAYKQEHLSPIDQKQRIPDPSSQESLVDQQKARIEAAGTRKKEPFFEGSDALGGEEMLQAVGFSCRRTEEDYKLDSETFVLRPSRWQNLIRRVSGTTWEEPDVPYPDADGGTITLPHPGKEGWKEWSALSIDESDKNFNADTGLPVSHENLEPEGVPSSPDTLEGRYPINVQNGE